MHDGGSSNQEGQRLHRGQLAQARVPNARRCGNNCPIRLTCRVAVGHPRRPDEPAERRTPGLPEP